MITSFCKAHVISEHLVLSIFLLHVFKLKKKIIYIYIFTIIPGTKNPYGFLNRTWIFLNLIADYLFIFLSSIIEIVWWTIFFFFFGILIYLFLLIAIEEVLMLNMYHTLRLHISYTFIYHISMVFDRYLFIPRDTFLT